jgi:uncharacterized protein YegP (UPF0339 family)
MAAKFEIRSPKAGQYQWVLVSQGRTLATGPAYPRRALAEKSIDPFRMAAIAAPVADLTLAPAKTAPGKVARVVGRAVGKAVVKSGRAVEKAEKAVAKPAKRAAGTVRKAAKKATAAAKPAAPRKRGSRKR